MNIVREYTCDYFDCGDGMKFVVFHSDSKTRQPFCVWCGQKPNETGRYWKTFKKNVIGYNRDGSKFEIFKRKDLHR